MKILKTDSNVTKRVKMDYNLLSNKEFFKKYSGTKRTYKKRVDRYGDPYMNAPLAKFGKMLLKLKKKSKQCLNKRVN